MFVPTFFLMDHNPHAQEIETVQVNQTVMLRPLLFGQGLVPWYHLLFCWGGGSQGRHTVSFGQKCMYHQLFVIN